MRARFERFAGWLVTSPAAFFLGFVIELSAYWRGVLSSRWRDLRRRRRAS